MKININQLHQLIEILIQQQLLNAEEIELANAIADIDFPFAKQLEIADSVHYHIHVRSIVALDHEIFVKHKGAVVNQAEGYIKYAFPDGINFIFSHIPVAHKEKTNHKEHESYLDHIGIDIRSDDKNAYLIFQQIPYAASVHDYLFTRQGDGKEAVKCCHMQVKEKYWVYPHEKMNYEFAFGPLVIHETGFGVDLRPANPFIALPDKGESACCSESKPKAGIFIN